MKKLSIALAATFMLSTTAPIMAAEIDYAPAPSCISEVEARYTSSDPLHAVLLSPLYVAHALLCHVFDKNS
ncbi:hypothetical protein MNBD_ALPHA09-955 [hydrothermal vent metagenome]|uniref:Uncharacterized protein n=1 Tax=hydrothermal vent metagenome TaxID=652676 RepID=A0A3B0TM86_9ZZZZ